MIGVIARLDQRAVVTEFFELFKTPWEFCTAGRRYDVIISTAGNWPGVQAELVLLYGLQTSLQSDADHDAAVTLRRENATLRHRSEQLPIFGSYATFARNPFGALTDDASGRPAAFTGRFDGKSFVRIGYDLFDEARHLLTKGQPAASAGTPTLELHIALLRELITGSGLPVVEIPALPDGHHLTVCLTHDIDHPLVRNHRCDHTMAGFLYRATVGSLVQFLRGRLSLRGVGRNLGAACKLPFVFLGFARDFWNTFSRYKEIESGLGATYFVIPEKGNPGRRGKDSAPATRGAGYEPADIKRQLESATKSGAEIGLHGIDAWRDSVAGQTERGKVARVAGTTVNGVRMHWLFFDETSPAVLDKAGFAYDSSVGFNETVGFRAGTAQAFKPLVSTNLLELPLIVMDTALFYPTYLSLDEQEAAAWVDRLAQDVARMGGALTINWHDRSIAPERLWDGFYVRLVDGLKKRGAWIPTAGQAVAWFRQRRSAKLETVRLEGGKLKIKATMKPGDQLPGLRIRVYQPRTGRPMESTSGSVATEYVDIPFNQNLEMVVAE